MTTLILYDSLYGNTATVAQAIGKGIGGDVLVLPAKDGAAIGWSSLKLVVVGSPTQGGRPTPALQKIFDTIHPGTIAKVRVAAFDTRFKEKDKNFALRILMKSIGYASDKIAKTLQEKGGTLTAPPEGFIVTGKEGPLADGELERAQRWGASLSK